MFYLCKRKFFKHSQTMSNNNTKDTSYLKLMYQVKPLGKSEHEVRTLYVEYETDALYKAFDKASKLGADPHKNVKWTCLTSELYAKEVCDKVKEDIMSFLNKKRGNGKPITTIVRDWLETNSVHFPMTSDVRDDIVKMVIGEWALKYEIE